MDLPDCEVDIGELAMRCSFLLTSQTDAMVDFKKSKLMLMEFPPKDLNNCKILFFMGLVTED